MLRDEVKMEVDRDPYMVDQIMDVVECKMWKKFDQMRDSGILTVKLWFITVDASGLVKKVIERLIGPRAETCI